MGCYLLPFLAILVHLCWSSAALLAKLENLEKLAANCPEWWDNWYNIWYSARKTKAPEETSGAILYLTNGAEEGIRTLDLILGKDAR